MPEQKKSELGSVKLGLPELQKLSLENFLAYFDARSKKVAGNIFNREIQTVLLPEFFRRVDEHEKKCVEILSQQLSLLALDQRIPPAYLGLLNAAIMNMYDAESKDELNMYYDYLTLKSPETVQGREIEKGGIRSRLEKTGANIPEAFWNVLEDFKQTRMTFLDSEKTHWKGVRRAYADLVLGASLTLPITGPAYSAYAWGTWGGQITNAKFNISVIKPPRPKEPSFWQRHKKKILIGVGATLGLATAIAAPFVIPIILGASALTIGMMTAYACSGALILGLSTSAGYGLSLWNTERQRANRVAERLDGFHKAVNTHTPALIGFVKSQEDVFLNQSSHTKVKKRLFAKKNKKIKAITKKCKRTIKSIIKQLSKKDVANRDALWAFYDDINKNGMASSEKIEEIIAKTSSISGLKPRKQMKMSEYITRLTDLRDEWNEKVILPMPEPLVEKERKAFPAELEKTLVNASSVHASINVDPPTKKVTRIR